MKAILESKHALLSDVTGWILSGHSMVITTAAVLSLSDAPSLSPAVKVPLCCQGGRTACAVALQRTDVKAVVLFSYPLHPPGKQVVQIPMLWYPVA